MYIRKEITSIVKSISGQRKPIQKRSTQKTNVVKPKIGAETKDVSNIIPFLKEFPV